jgi:hypothetical protein
LAGEGAFISRLTMTQNPLQSLPHPFIEGGCLLAVGVGSPSLMLMELVAKGEPQVVHKAAMPDHMPLLGLGLLQVREHGSHLLGVTYLKLHPSVYMKTVSGAVVL